MTPREQYYALKKYAGLAYSSIAGYRENLSRSDFEEMQADAMYAIFRAIDAYDAHHASKATVETLITRYTRHAAFQFVRKLATRRGMFESGTVSANQPAFRNDDTPLIDFVPSRDEAEKIDAGIAVETVLKAVDNLSQQNVLWGLSRTKRDSDVSEDMELSRQRISQIKIAAIKAIKRKIQEREDWGFWAEEGNEGK